MSVFNQIGENMTDKNLNNLFKCTHLDDLHCLVNEIYTQWDEGEIKKNKATKRLINYCKEFIEYNTKERENGK